MLTSWKEIAAFFGKGVRTVQRWESMGMPVHRPSTDRNIVFADPEELRKWALRRHANHTLAQQHQQCRRLIEESQREREKTRELIRRSRELRERQSLSFLQAD